MITHFTSPRPTASQLTSCHPNRVRFDWWSVATAANWVAAHGARRSLPRLRPVTGHHGSAEMRSVEIRSGEVG